MTDTANTRKPVVNFVIDPALLRRVDDFWHIHQFPNRATTVKWLLDWALKHNPKEMRRVKR
jgi:hypothetical protein